MDTRNQHQRRGARFSHPLLVLSIAAVAAIGAISQCGLLLDAASASSIVARTPVQALPRTPVTPVERPRVAVVQSVGASTGDARSN